VHLLLGQAAWHPSKNHRGIRRIAGDFLLNLRDFSADY
jgi:hypothetical protein